MTITAINAGNPCRGKIKAITLGTVVSEVEAAMPHGVVASAVATRPVRDLGLEAGAEVLAIVKAADVPLAKR